MGPAYSHVLATAAAAVVAAVVVVVLVYAVDASRRMKSARQRNVRTVMPEVVSLPKNKAFYHVFHIK